MEEEIESRLASGVWVWKDVRTLSVCHPAFLDPDSSVPWSLWWHCIFQLLFSYSQGLTISRTWPCLLTASWLCDLQDHLCFFHPLLIQSLSLLDHTCPCPWPGLMATFAHHMRWALPAIGFTNSGQRTGVARHLLHNMRHLQKKIFNSKDDSGFLLESGNLFLTQFFWYVFWQLLVQLYDVPLEVSEHYH